MYRVIVVDDEVWSVIGLTKILKEDSSRFELIYETTDPLEALEQICALKPDVVFSDVRMPEMSGLDLMYAVRARGVNTNFVFISGFAEFSYVQQALEAGALEYHLKPLARSSVLAMLDRVCEKLDASNSLSDLEFYSLLRDKRERVPELLRSRFGHDLNKKLQVVFFLRTQGAEDVRIPVWDNAQSMSLKIGPTKCMYIINSEDDRTASVQDCLNSQQDRLEKAAISRAVDDVSSFEQLVKETEIIIRDSFVYPDQKVFRYRMPRMDVLSRLENEIESLFSEKKYQQIAQIYGSLPQIFSEYGMGVTDASYFWNRVALHSITNRNTPDRVMDYMDLFGLTERFASLKEMASYLERENLNIRDDKNKSVSDKFQEMLRYIDENYAEPLYLRELCSQFYINMSYCCELFQKNENMTFSQYLTHVRISKACQMMRFQRATVSEACERVGYKDYFYFNKVFKKKVGCTPAEYRKTVLKDV